MSALLLWAACGLGGGFAEDEIAQTLASTYCSRLHDCARGDYEALYFGRNDCERQNTVVYDALVAGFAECEYSEAEAEQAVGHLDQLNCGDFHDVAYAADYAEIWTSCPAGGGIPDSGAP